MKITFNVIVHLKIIHHIDHTWYWYYWSYWYTNTHKNKLVNTLDKLSYSRHAIRPYDQVMWLNSLQGFQHVYNLWFWLWYNEIELLSVYDPELIITQVYLDLIIIICVFYNIYIYLVCTYDSPCHSSILSTFALS